MKAQLLACTQEDRNTEMKSSFGVLSRAYTNIQD